MFTDIWFRKTQGVLYEKEKNFSISVVAHDYVITN